MRISRADRKKLRSAAKKLRFEKKREKLAARNRMPKYIFCFACAGAGLACFAACVSIIMQLYADYRYRTRISTLELPTVTAPCYIRTTIEYQGSAPEKITLSESGRDIPPEDIDITDDPGSKTLIIGYDTNTPSSDYLLSVWPGDNFELVYKTALEPSYKYMRYMADAYGDAQGDLWLDIACSFERLPGNIKISVYGRGDKYASVLVKAEIRQNVRYELNISEIARRRNIDMDKIDAFRVSFHIDGEGSGLDILDEDIELSPESWPAYDPEATHAYSLADTDRYVPVS